MAILICYDGSDSARRAIVRAAEIFPAAQAIVLNAWVPPLDVMPDAWSAPRSAGSVTTAQLESLACDRAEQLAGEGQQLALEHGLAATVALRRADGGIWRAILDEAAARGADLVVLGTRGHDPSASGLLGSVANAVAHHAHVPLLIVPTPDQPVAELQAGLTSPLSRA